MCSDRQPPESLTNRWMGFFSTQTIIPLVYYYHSFNVLFYYLTAVSFRDFGRNACSSWQPSPLLLLKLSYSG